MATRELSVTASDLGTFADCEARYYHTRQGYETGLLPTDRTAADVSSALHDALMEIHRQLEPAVRTGSMPSPVVVRARLHALLGRHLMRRRVDASSPAVAGRLAPLAAGIDRAARLIAESAGEWATDPSNGDPLVWVEAPLDHGPEIKGVQLSPGFLVRTRADVIGLCPGNSARCRAVIRDFKARAEVVDPAYDDGILVRAFWALTELQNPRCRWFVAGRAIVVDAGGVELETVNLMHADGQAFLVAANLTARQLLAHRDRIVDTMARMEKVLAAPSADAVVASPSVFCLNWCPFLNRCAAGMAHVRKYHGAEELQARLGEV